MNIVGIGGGTGLPVLLRGLKQLRDRNADGSGDDRVTAAAIVCVSDDGGSSGALRQAFDIPAVGDLRNCLVALADGHPVLGDLFQYRLCGDFGLDGHSLGNLIVAALSSRAGNLRRAIQIASEVLNLRGTVLPCTEASARLCAEFVDGDTACGETSIAARRKRIRRIWLDMPSPSGGGIAPTAGVIETILEADALILGPGSLYTSVIPCLLPSGVAEAVRQSAALKILVCNLMTQPGETDSYSAADHVRALQEYLGPGGVHVCLLNSAPIPSTIANAYAAEGAEPVPDSTREIENLGVVPIILDLLDASEPEARHDPLKLARWIVALTRAFKRTREKGRGQMKCVAAAEGAALITSPESPLLVTVP